MEPYLDAFLLFLLVSLLVYIAEKCCDQTDPFPIKHWTRILHPWFDVISRDTGGAQSWDWKMIWLRNCKGR